MGYRDCNILEKCGEAEFRTMTVVMVRKDDAGEELVATQVLLVDNHGESLRYAREHMEQLATNVLRVKRLDDRKRRRMEESAALFEKNLEPLFSMISNRSDRLLGTLRCSLKKALLLMAMDRYHCNQDEVCQALGLSRDQLARELRICGISPP